MTRLDKIKTKLSQKFSCEEFLSNAAKDFDHPCKNTCSGWKQGRDRGWFDVADDIAYLIKQVEKMKKVLEFYANEKNWMTTRKDILHEAKMTIIGDPRSYGAIEQPGLASTLLVIGGKRAEECLADLERSGDD